MANLIDYTYFVNEINVPDANGTYSNLTQFITRFEKEYLIKVLGYTLYKLVAAYDVDHPENSEQRIRDIIEGKEFTETSGGTTFTYKWNGLKNTEKISPIAYYVYFFHKRDSMSLSSGSGEKRLKGESTDAIDASFKDYEAWNRMIDLTGLSTEYRIDSLYYFMKDNLTTYPEWEFEDLGDYQNSYGL